MARSITTIESDITFFWRTGQAEVFTGRGNTRIDRAADALNDAGYGGGALGALDFYGEGDIRDEWTWNAERREWEPVQ